MHHHLGTDLLKGGVYDSGEAVEGVSYGEERHLASMEVRAVAARNRARLWQDHLRSKRRMRRSRQEARNAVQIVLSG